MDKGEERYIVTAFTEHNGKKEELYSMHGVLGINLAKNRASYFETFYKDRGIDVKTEIINIKEFKDGISGISS